MFSTMCYCGGMFQQDQFGFLPHRTRTLKICEPALAERRTKLHIQLEYVQTLIQGLDGWKEENS